MPQGKGEKATAKQPKAPNSPKETTGGADLSRGYKSLGKYNPATDGSGPTSDRIHKGYRSATENKG